MGYRSLQVPLRDVRRAAKPQRGRITHAQLLELGLTPRAIKHRVEAGKLKRRAREVFEVWVPDDSFEGACMTAVLACGSGAVLSGEAALFVYDLALRQPTGIEVSVPADRVVVRPEAVVRRRGGFLASEAAIHGSIPITSPALTVIDNARRLGTRRLEAVISDADARRLVTPRVVHETALRLVHVPGSKEVRMLLGRRLFRMTRSELERWFLRIVRRLNLPIPTTQAYVNGLLVDFYWEDLGLVVETDGGSYHRTPGQQTNDRRRDQRHLAAGMTPLRFTHEQVRYNPAEVESVLLPLIARLMNRPR